MSFLYENTLARCVRTHLQSLFHLAQRRIFQLRAGDTNPGEDAYNTRAQRHRMRLGPESLPAMHSSRLEY